MEARCSEVERVVGLTMPRLPSLTGKARSSQTVSLGGALLVRAGISREQMQSLRGCRSRSMLGVVLHR